MNSSDLNRNGFRSALGRLLTPEGFANTVLPIAGIIESIVSKGASPGTVATKQRQTILDDLQRQQAHEQAEWERRQKQQENKDIALGRRLRRENIQLDIDEKKRKRDKEKNYKQSTPGMFEPDIRPSMVNPAMMLRI
jgi:hypothetical protein